MLSPTHATCVGVRTCARASVAESADQHEGERGCTERPPPGDGRESRPAYTLYVQDAGALIETNNRRSGRAALAYSVVGAQAWTFADPHVRCAPHVRHQQEPRERPVRRLELPSAILSYRRTGSGPAVLFIQGVGVVGEGWRPQVDGLRDRCTAISFDNRGIGGSEHPGGQRSPSRPWPSTRWRSWTPRGSTASTSRRTRWAGSSRRRSRSIAPGRVKSLALLCTFARGKQAARLTPDIIVVGLRTRIGTRAMRRNAFLGLVMPPAVLAGRDRTQLAEGLAPLFGHDLADQPPIILKQVAAMAEYDASARLGQLAAIPTLVAAPSWTASRCPRSDASWRRRSRARASSSSPGAGHGVPIHRRPRSTTSSPGTSPRSRARPHLRSCGRGG